MHGNTVGRHGRTTDARGARVRRHGRARRTSGVRRAALTLMLCVAALLLSPVNAFADTGLGEYLNNDAGATSVAYEYLTGDSWDDISHEGNSAPATALLMASTSGTYRNFAAFVDSLYHSQINAVQWYSRLEGIAFLNACTSARADIQQCLREHPLNNGGSGSGGNDTSGSANGGIDVKMTMYPGTYVLDRYGDQYYSTGTDGNLKYKSDYEIKLPSEAKNFVTAHNDCHIFVTLELCTAYDSQVGQLFTFWRCYLYAFDYELWEYQVNSSNYQVNQSTESIPYSFTYRTKDNSIQPFERMYLESGKREGEHIAPYEITFTKYIAPVTTYNSSVYQFSKGDYYKSFNYTLGVGDDYVPPIAEPVNPTPPDPDEPSNEAPTNVVIVPTVFDTSDIVEAIEILDADLVAAFNNQNAYLQELFQYLNDDLANYFYTLDNDLVNCIKWLKQELEIMLADVKLDMNDGFADVVEELEGVRDDIDYFLYRIELQLSNIYTRLGQILSKMGSGGGGGGNTSSRPDPSDDGDGFLDWLLDLFQTGLEDLLDTLNLTGLLSKFNLLRQKFPFSIPWDIAAIIALFVHEPVTPVIEIPYPTIAINGVNYQVLRIDFTSWQLLGQACRDGTFILFAFGLMLRTKSLLDGEKVS